METPASGDRSSKNSIGRAARAMRARSTTEDVLRSREGDDPLITHARTAAAGDVALRNHLGMVAIRRMGVPGEHHGYPWASAPYRGIHGTRCATADHQFVRPVTTTAPAAVNVRRGYEMISPRYAVPADATPRCHAPDIHRAPDAVRKSRNRPGACAKSMRAMTVSASNAASGPSHNALHIDDEKPD